MEAVTLRAIIRELLNQMISDGPMPDPIDRADRVVKEIGFNTKALMVANTTRLCEMFASLSSILCKEEAGFIEEAALEAKATLINGFLRDLLSLLLETQKKASFEVEKITGPRPVRPVPVTEVSDR